jgi:hypothetical protein
MTVAAILVSPHRLPTMSALVLVWSFTAARLNGKQGGGRPTDVTQPALPPQR